jgi:hypothetical protein
MGRVEDDREDIALGLSHWALCGEKWTIGTRSRIIVYYTELYAGKGENGFRKYTVSFHVKNP